MLPEQWKKEVAKAIEESASTWSLMSADCDQGSLECYARLVKTGQQPRKIRVILQPSDTTESIRADIRRQLAALG